MSLRINERYCVACGLCLTHCKNGAIKENNETQLYRIDPDRCTECVGWYAEPRCYSACFLSAPEADPTHKESHEELLAKWKKLHPGKVPQAI